MKNFIIITKILIWWVIGMIVIDTGSYAGSGILSLILAFIMVYPIEY